MKILFYDTKKYDKESFDKVLPKYEDIEIEYVDSDISVRNAVYALSLIHISLPSARSGTKKP